MDQANFERVIAETEATIAARNAANPSVVNNITVNGAIDSESTARQIVDVMNSAYYRGTLGAVAFVS